MFHYISVANEVIMNQDMFHYRWIEILMKQDIFHYRWNEVIMNQDTFHHLWNEETNSKTLVYFSSKYVKMRPASVTMLRDPIMQFISQFHSRRTDVAEDKRQMVLKEREKPGEGKENYNIFFNKYIMEWNSCVFQSVFFI